MPTSRSRTYVWRKFWTRVQIDSLSYYLERLHTELENMAEDFKESVETEARRLGDGKESKEFFGYSVVERWYHEKVFPRLFLSSFHLSAYSLLETEICDIANRIGNKQKQRINLSETRGGEHLEPAVRYIKKLTGIDAKQFSSWNRLKDGQELRNIIAHSNGKVTDPSDVSLATKCKVYDKSEQEVSVTYAYCKRFVKLLRTFFSEMYKQIEAGNFL
jgi:hypothetical protein